MARTTLVTAVEVRTPDVAPITIDQMPVTLETEGNLTALVFHTSSELTSVTVLLSPDDREDLIHLLSEGKK